MSGSFADSNVVLYLPSDAPKARVVRQMLNEDLTISVQVLNEVANVFITKWKRSWRDADELLDLLREGTRVVAMDEQVHELGVSVAKRHRLSIYDSMIVAAALQSKCTILYSEDMHHGLLIENQLRIVNPFLGL